MATIAEQLTSLNTNLNTINSVVGNQATLIARIKAAAESLPDAEGGNNSPSGRITDLTGTTWKLNSGTIRDAVAVPSNSYYSINFTSNGENFVNIRSHDGQTLVETGYPDYPFIGYGKDMYSWTEVYKGSSILQGTWKHYNYRIIEIIDGNDVTNENLINVLYRIGNPISSGSSGEAEVIAYEDIPLKIQELIEPHEDGLYDESSFKFFEHYAIEESVSLVVEFHNYTDYNLYVEWDAECESASQEGTDYENYSEGFVIPPHETTARGFDSEYFENSQHAWSYQVNGVRFE